MKLILFALVFVVFGLTGCTQEKNYDMKFNKLTPEEQYVILNKGTERPFTGIYDKFYEEGTYHCKQCDAALYNSDSKFKSGCGWPSFDDEIEGAVKRIPDQDGRRTEIVCANCNGHLGHVFEGEGFTDKDTRHCVNSVSLKFVPADIEGTETAYFASGCFWGTEYYLQKAKGIVSTTVGYIGGTLENPTYKEVCTGRTGHAEAVEVVFDPKQISYEELAKLFFETHDPTQVNRQGPDIGEQYRSEIFYTNESQKAIADSLILILKEKGITVATKVTKASQFWKAEAYHQDYYDIKGSTPYCHSYIKRF